MIENKEKLDNCKEQIKVLVSALESEFNHVIVTSGYRSPKYNAQIGGAKNSAHIHGEAVDIQVPNVHCIKVAAWILYNVRKYPIWGLGIDVYQNYCHFDIKERPMLSTWVYDKQGKPC